jgi:hypothetical protein
MSDSKLTIFRRTTDEFSPAGPIDGYPESMILTEITFHLADTKTFIWSKTWLLNGRNG